MDEQGDWRSYEIVNFSVTEVQMGAIAMARIYLLNSS